MAGQRAPPVSQRAEPFCILQHCENLATVTFLML